jgi:glycerate 2-kinase
VACDVNNPLYGPEGASRIYGPQKGATPKMVEQLDRGLENFACQVKKHLNKDILDLPGAGAAGGLGGGLVAFLDAILRPGMRIMTETAKLEEKIKSAQLVFTGEGKTDAQTAYGKVPAGVASIAKQYGVPVICLSGALDERTETLYNKGITGLFSIINRPMTLDEAMENAHPLLIQAAENLMRLYISANTQTGFPP